jgi:hypothetical protein
LTREEIKTAFTASG